MVLDPHFLSTLGIVDFGYLEGDEALSFDRYEKWVDRKRYVPLNYLADHRKDLRRSLKNYFPQFQSALVFLFSYAQEKRDLDKFYQSDESNGLKIASYVFGFEGRDYHQVVREKLLIVKKELIRKYPDTQIDFCLDIQPVLERDMAFRAGLGWFGKNSMLLSRAHGSFTMIGSLLLSRKLPIEKKVLETDHCGQCQLCIEACPTKAIDSETRTILSRDCLSTFTIELFKGDELAPVGMEKGTGEIFGCDICQDVCPWNERPFRHRQFMEETSEITLLKEAHSPSQKLFQFFLKRPIEMIIDELERWSNKKFKREFKDTPLERTGRKALLRNLKSQRQILKEKGNLDS